MAVVFRGLGVLTILIGLLYGFIMAGSATSDFGQFMSVMTALGIGVSSLIWFFMGEVVGLMVEIRDRLPVPQPAPETEVIAHGQDEGRPA